MTQLLMSLTDIRILDVIDILIVLILVWQIYKLLRGTIAFNIFIGLMLLYGIWYAVSYLDMRLLTFLLGPFVGFGVLILIIIFQPEIRQFLLFLGNNTLKNRFTFLERLWGDQVLTVMEIVDDIYLAMQSFREERVGALIVLSNNRETPIWNNSGQVIDAKVSSQLLRTIFQKESPIHDGAAIMINDRIYSVSVILPVTENNSMDADLGLRHRAAVGVSEKTNATAFVVSEENGSWSVAVGGKLTKLVSPTALKVQLKEALKR
jgi:uncharacterized protein (TIGR00159 family)